MKTFGKVLLWCFFVAGGLLVVSVTAVVLFFPKEWAKEKAVAHLSKELGQPVAIGDVDFGIFPPISLSLKEIAVGSSQDPAKPQVSVSEFELKLRLLALLNRKVEIESLRIVRPVVEMLIPETDQKKTKEPTGEKATSKEKETGELQLEKFEIVDGSVIVRKPGWKNPFIEIGGFNESLRLSANTDGQLQLEGTTRIEKILLRQVGGVLGRGLTIRFDKQLAYDLQKDHLEVQKAELTLGDLPLSVKGEVRGVQEPRPEVDLDVRGGPANVKSILAYLPSSLFPQLEGIQSEGNVELRIMAKGKLPKDVENLGGFQFAVKFDLQNGEVFHPQFPAPVEKIQIALAANSRFAELSRFHAEIDGSTLDLTLRVDDYLDKKPLIDARVKGDLDLAKALALQPQQSVRSASGHVRTDLSVKGRPSELKTLKYDGTLHLANVSVDVANAPVPVSGVSGALELKDDVFQLKALQLNLGKSDLRLDGKLQPISVFVFPEYKTEPFRLEARLVSRNLDLDQLLPKESAKKEESGGTLPVEFIERFVADLSMKAQKMVFNGLDMQNVQASLKIDRGKVSIEKMSVNAFSGQMAVNGTVDASDLNSPTFDLNLDMKQVEMSEVFGYATNLNKLARVGRYFSGKFNADAKFTGSLNDKMELNLGALNSVGSLSMNRAKVSGHPLQTSLAGYLDKPALQTADLGNWFQKFRIENGKLNLSDLSFAAAGIKFDVQGWQALDGNLNMGMNVDLPKSLSDKVQSKLPSQVSKILFDGPRISLPFEADGQFTSPNLRLNHGKLTDSAKARAQEKLAAERARLEAEAKKKLAAEQKKLQDEAKKKLQQEAKKAVPPEVKEETKKLKEETKDKAKDLFKKLF